MKTKPNKQGPVTYTKAITALKTQRAKLLETRDKTEKRLRELDLKIGGINHRIAITALTKGLPFPTPETATIPELKAKRASLLKEMADSNIKDFSGELGQKIEELNHRIAISELKKIAMKPPQKE